MAVAPTGAIYKALEFDGVSSRTYGVYITGEAVYNAPERDVEMITIPGRNGSFALDNGRFQNIEVSYPAGIFAETEADFRAAISDFRNFLCSRNGYVRLQDEYNPDEYRMAVYKSGLEVTPAQLKAGEFTITFDCKPQRWLTSGENAVTIANSGDTITNPTLFESSPLLEVEGYGTIEFNGYEIELNNETMGELVLANGAVNKTTAVIPQGVLNVGDQIHVNATFVWCINRPGTAYTWDRSYYSKSADTYTNANTTAEFPASDSQGRYTFTTTITNELFVFGTARTITNEVDVDVKTIYGGVEYPSSAKGKQKIIYDGQRSFVFSNQPTKVSGKISVSALDWSYEDIIGDSSVSLLGNPTYIDCDLGEAYKYAGSDIISLNKYINLGSNLPVLASGSNEFTLDNTITDLKVIPRWWKI